MREPGIPLETFRVVGSDGRRIAAYRFGDPSSVRITSLSGRVALTSALKRELIEKHGERCHLHCDRAPAGDLQIDHRVPFEIAGDPTDANEDTDAYMLVCASANRAKSWTCEHCPNWSKKDADVCRTCYWAFPEDYAHVATREVRRLDLIRSGEETADYDRLQAEVDAREDLPEHVKRILRSHLGQGAG